MTGFGFFREMTGPSSSAKPVGRHVGNPNEGHVGNPNEDVTKTQRGTAYYQNKSLHQKCSPENPWLPVHRAYRLLHLPISTRQTVEDRDIDNISLASIPDCLESPVIGPQLPTPRDTPHPEGPVHIPGISDTLFDLPETFLDSGDNSPNWTYTTPSRNMMLTIVDQNGVFEHEVVFCVCSKDDVKDELLLHSRLFPATFKSIKTVFAFSVLDDFLRDNLECKTTAQQYYSKLQSTTSKMFPNLVPNLYKQLLRASCQWRDLKNRMEQGLGHQEGKDIQEGAMGVFCPACPQPGINLPDDWKHMKHRSGEKDIALSAGMGFMADPEPYKAHLQTRRQIDQISKRERGKSLRFCPEEGISQSPVPGI
ncbi:hypothetical protein EI94DRAFT_1704553 [Lactarius quietus]|nr:hypothetical protein EI94DRAFT_1704553 [Lactarius quietus]